MSKTKKKGGSIFSVLIVFILLLLVAATVGLNVIFSGDRVPMVGGYYLYLQESADMEPDIEENSFVLAKEAGQTALQKGSKVLCYLNDGNMALRVIYNIEVNEDGSTSYFPGTAVEQGEELAIERGNIFAVCTWYSKELYTVVKFATSVMGLFALLVVPCIILIIMLLVKIAKSSREEIDDEEFMFEDEEDYEDTPKKRRRRPAQDPLFDPERVNIEDESLEKKKASIQEHFSEKPVNEDSPYQKAVQERTMKFKRIEQEDIERAKREEAERAAAQASQQTSEVAAEPVQETATEQTGYVPTHSSDVPVIHADEAEPAPVRPATPNIDDIINPGELRAAKAGAKYNPEISGTGSIDDLIAALENEKKKL